MNGIMIFGDLAPLRNRAELLKLTDSVCWYREFTNTSLAVDVGGRRRSGLGMNGLVPATMIFPNQWLVKNVIPVVPCVDPSWRTERKRGSQIERNTPSLFCSFNVLN